LSRCLEEGLAIENRPLQEECVHSDGPQFIEQLPPFRGRAGDLRLRELEKGAP
jgi:hypothetical protein